MSEEESGENEESKENEDGNPFGEWEKDVSEVEADPKVKLLEALSMSDMRLTHVAAVASYAVSDEDGEEFDFTLIVGGPDQPVWLTKSLLQRGLDKWNEEEEFARDQRLNQAMYQISFDEDPDEDDD